MPLGLMYIAAFLKQAGKTVRMVDAEALRLGAMAIIDVAVEYQPRIVGLNCHTLNRHVVYDLVRLLQFACPGSKIVLGGPHPSLAPGSVFRECSAVNIIVIGEGEQTMLELCNRSEDLEGVRGIAFRSGEGVRFTPPRPRITALDDLPFPDLADLPVHEYLRYSDPDLPGLWNRAYLSATRGCRFRCSYCTEHAFWSGGSSVRTAQSVIDEMLAYRQAYGVDRFYFYDDTFTDWPHLFEFCQSAGELGFTWSCSTRIEQMSPDTIRKMAEGGCREVAFGLESGSKLSLQSVHKNWQGARGHSVASEVIKACNEQRIAPRAHFILGFPWEAATDITATVKLALTLRKSGLRDANFFVFKVYPGTEISKQIVSDPDQTIVSVTEHSEEAWYDAWSVYDWFRASSPQVAAKLKRFNDIPLISPNPRFESIELRLIVRKAYELFFAPTILAEALVHDALWASSRPNSK
ncbi:MAG: radical SAM protein [Fimbriimonas sp.]|nr:radical SAM protein [Fimbriimonas sp.]